MTMRVDSSVRVTTEAMVGRATAAPAERTFRAALGEGATVLLSGVESATRALPGGEVLAAALHSASSEVRSAGTASVLSGSSTSGTSELTESGTSDVASYASALSGSSSDQLELIALQQQIQDENRRYSTLSNVLKARHETAKNAIGNIR